MGVNEGDLQVKYRCRRNHPGKLSNNYCYTYLMKDQHLPINSNNLLVYSMIS